MVWAQRACLSPLAAGMIISNRAATVESKDSQLELESTSQTRVLVLRTESEANAQPACAEGYGAAGAHLSAVALAKSEHPIRKGAKVSLYPAGIERNAQPEPTHRIFDTSLLPSPRSRPSHTYGAVSGEERHLARVASLNCWRSHAKQGRRGPLTRNTHYFFFFAHCFHDRFAC